MSNEDIQKKQREIADYIFENADFFYFNDGKVQLKVADHNGWEIEVCRYKIKEVNSLEDKDVVNSQYAKTVFFENKNGGDSVSSFFIVTFINNNLIPNEAYCIYDDYVTYQEFGDDLKIKIEAAGLLSETQPEV